MSANLTVPAGQTELALPISPSRPRHEPQVSPAGVRVAGRMLTPTPVFDTYWRFAALRQAVYQARVAGAAGPWTDDPVLRKHRFTNCYRAADRVSQFLIRRVSYCGSQDPTEVVFRTLLFKMFNKVSTWQLLNRAFGQPSWVGFDTAAYDEVLTRAHHAGDKLYSAAYVIPPPRLGAERKHSNHLRLLHRMMSDDITGRVRDARSLRGVFQVLRGYPAMGDFLAYQFAIDLNYSAVLDFDEMDYVVAGPGARDGIRKCFGPAADGLEPEVIRYMAEYQDEHFDRLGLRFDGLWGRPLQLIDCQNLFCEVDKYARVVHPDISGHSGRSRIKQHFAPVADTVDAWFPPKWQLGW